jgi:phage FluMu protein Com
MTGTTYRDVRCATVNKGSIKRQRKTTTVHHSCPEEDFIALEEQDV